MKGRLLMVVHESLPAGVLEEMQSSWRTGSVLGSIRTSFSKIMLTGTIEERKWGGNVAQSGGHVPLVRLTM